MHDSFVIFMICVRLLQKVESEDERNYEAKSDKRVKYTHKLF